MSKGVRMDRIYTITAMSKDGRYKRIFGYFFWFTFADQAVRENWSDIWETSYDWVVIEEVESGIHPINEEEWWYEYDIKKEGYFPIDKPDKYKKPIECKNFGIG